MKRHALLIGIDEWRDNRINPLRCAEQDALDVTGLLHRLRFDRVELLPGKKADSLHIFNVLKELAAGLSENDLFLFYYAGHGITDKAAHWLYFWEAQIDTLNITNPIGMIAVHDLLAFLRKQGTFHRLLITDACRNSWESGRDTSNFSFSGADCYRNIASWHMETDHASQVIINSCEDQKRARELKENGLFTQAMLDVLNQRLIAGRSLWINTVFRDELGRRMQSLAQANGWPPDEQWPLFIEGRPLPFSLDGSTAQANASQTDQTLPRTDTPIRESFPANADCTQKRIGTEYINRWESLVETFCAECGKQFLTQLDHAGRCQFPGCNGILCNHCWLAMDKRFCRQHKPK